MIPVVIYATNEVEEMSENTKRIYRLSKVYDFLKHYERNGNVL